MADSPSTDQPDVPEDQPALPAVPRPPSGRTKRALVAEPRIRILLLGSAMVLGISLFLALQGGLKWNRERELVRNGTPVTATVIEANGSKLPQRQRWQSDLLLEYEVGGKKVRTLVALAVPPKKDDLFILPGDKVEIKVDARAAAADPTNPRNITNKTQPDPLLNELFVPGLMFVIAAMVGYAAAWLYTRYLAVWKNGTAQPAVLLGLSQSPIAPLARVARCYLVDSPGKSSALVYLPATATHKEGEVIWVIAPASAPNTRSKPASGPVLLAARYA